MAAEERVVWVEETWAAAKKAATEAASMVEELREAAAVGSMVAIMAAEAKAASAEAGTIRT